jgi:hypothetical protein
MKYWAVTPAGKIEMPDRLAAELSVRIYTGLIGGAGFVVEKLDRAITENDSLSFFDGGVCNTEWVEIMAIDGGEDTQEIVELVDLVNRRLDAAETLDINDGYPVSSTEDGNTEALAVPAA